MTSRARKAPVLARTTRGITPPRVRDVTSPGTNALELLGRVQQAHLARPGLFLQTADLYMKLGRWDEAEQTYAKALTVDPDNPHAHVGMSRLALRRRATQAGHPGRPGSTAGPASTHSPSTRTPNHTIPRSAAYRCSAG